MADLKDMKGVSDRDKAMIADAEQLLGAEPESMGVAKNYFWGRIREDKLFPYPQAIPPEEVSACDQLVARLEEYLRTEHPAVQIDQEQEIPRWVVDRLFEMGVLGMTISKSYGGLGMGITSYNRVLETIGKYCGSTAVMVSAHQSIGCKAVMLFGNDEQKQKWLPHLAKDWLSAFCLSEPNVGCDAGGQETRCEKSPDGEFFILNGEKKWATSGALSGMFTVMCKQIMADGKEKVTALVCTPEMAGIDIFQKNRSKCGIRGTWQARIRFKDVRVPKAHLLGQEGKGLNIALTCLNYGRCTLSAGMLGGARTAMDQSVTWAQTRHQFKRPLADFDLVKQKIARMAAYVYAMDAMLYMTTGFLDRKDEDIMVETAICKVFCSEWGWRTVNDAVQIMGGEGYMTENEVERIFRDSRINIIVEGANEVMQSFIFAYGGKQLAEHMLGVRDAAKRSPFKPAVIKAGLPIAKEVFLGIRGPMPRLTRVHSGLSRHAERLSRLVRELTYQFKMASKKHDAKIIERQCVQARLADAAILIHAFGCTLSKLDLDVRQANGGPASLEHARDRAAAEHFFDLAEKEIDAAFRSLNDEVTEQADESMLKAADAALAYSTSLPAEQFVIPERSPTDLRGKGRTPTQQGIKQFPGDKHAPAH